MEQINEFNKLDLSKYTSKLSISTKNPYLETVEEIWRYFNKELAFPMLMKMCKTKGIDFIRAIYIETEKAGKGKKYFMWKYGGSKQKYENNN